MINMDTVLPDTEKYRNKINFTGEKLDMAICDALKKVDLAMKTLGEDFASHHSINGVYFRKDNIEGGWNQGFWTGILWIAYELTKGDKYKNLAMKHIPSFYKRIDEKLGVNHHDMGFLYMPSCVEAYNLFGDSMAKEAAVKAADHLLSRYREKGKFIQAWGDIDDPSAYRLIIDCLLNIPLLYWATKVTGCKKYDEAAYNHFKTTLNNIFRPDGSVYHTFYFDPKTGKPVKGVTAQGYSDDSCWSRGQAWAVYGIILTYAYHNDSKILPIEETAVNYFLNHLPKDYVAYWDLIFGDGSGEPRDSSASAIFVCGLIELIKHLPNDNELKPIYENAVELIMDSLYENYSTRNCAESNGLLLHATYSKPANIGVDECNIWGCYYYMEALMRLKNPGWKPCWLWREAL